MNRLKQFGRRWLAMVLALLLCCGFGVLPASAAAQADAAVVELWTADDLRAMAQAPDGCYLLMADIDMAGEEWVPFGFTGKLDGQGFGIYNLTVTSVGSETEISVDGNRKQYDTVFAGLFSTLKGGEVSRLSLVNFRADITSDTNCFVGTLAGYTQDCTVADCRFTGSISLSTTGINVGLGGIAGFGTGTFASCIVDAVLVHDSEKAAVKPEQFTGGVMGCGFCTVLDCNVHIEGYTSCRGYVHDGGLVGMHYRYDKSVNAAFLYGTGNTTSGFISFFEDNADRRAYCAAYVGENLGYGFYVPESQNNTTFERRETRDYKTVLTPHGACQGTEFTKQVTDPTPKAEGYTTYTCKACGYRYTDDYLPQTHSAKSWDAVRSADYDRSGLEKADCDGCGRELYRFVAAKKAAETLTAPEKLSLHYKGTGKITCTVSPADADEVQEWRSSDPSVVLVNERGEVTALKKGTATVTCTTDHSGLSAAVEVEVGYSPVQWLIVIFLFGWIWY